MDASNRRSLSLVALLLSAPAFADNVAQTLPFTQSWSDAGVITASDNWSSCPGIIGYRGDALAATASDPQLVTADGTNTPQSVLANLTAVTSTAGGLAEFQLSNPVVGFQGSGTARAPFLLLHLDTRGMAGITVSYLLRDLDASGDNSVQAVALQFRVGSSGTFTNVPAGFVSDASSGPNLATQTNAVSTVLPASANDQPLVQVRILTVDATGADEWIGVDDLSVTGSVILRGVGTATPSTVAAGTNALLTVAVTPASNPASTGLAVSADLTSIGGSATQAFVDDGTGGDASAGDNIFSFDASTTGSSAGLKSFPVTVTDAQSRTASTTLNLTVQVPAPPSGVVTFTPATVNIGEQSLLTVAVTPGTVPSSTGLTVTADLSALGGSATQALLDDGNNGDVTPADDTFSYRVNVPLAQSPGAQTVDVLISDAQSRSATPSGTLTVRTPTNPSVVSTATPSTVVLGAQTLLTVAVTAGTNPTSSGVTVSGELTALGGSASQAFFDDGTNGDVTGGDGTFSFLASVPGATSTGSKSIPLAIADAQGRAANSSISLEVTLGASPTATGDAAPSSLLAGASTLLTVAVTPGVSPASTGLAVSLDLTSIGGSATAAALDDGAGADATAGDNVFSLQATVGASTPQGGKSLAVSVSDAQGRSGTATIPLTVLGPTNPSGTGLATPASLLPGNQTLLTVTVTAGTNPTSTGLAVSADLSSIGGSATQVFVDDGTGGDVTAADSIFSFEATVPGGTSPGARTLPVTITDAQARTGNANLALDVTAPPTPPSAIASASPSMLPAGALSLLTVTVTPGTNPASTSLSVSVDLTELGGSSTQAFLDDGLLGDASAGDDVFSFRAVIAAATPLGAKSLPVSVVDGQGRSATTTLALTVTPASVGPMASGTAMPSSVAAGSMTTFEVTVTPGANPSSTGLTATIDLRPIGGGSAHVLHDDGLNGDAAAADGVYSFSGTVTLATAPGTKTLTVTVTDAQQRTATTAIALTVTPAPSNPSAVAAANPSTLTPGGTTLLTVTVTPGAMPVSTGLVVTSNLTSLGLAAAQSLVDDGTMGDVTAGDNVFSFSATLPAGVLPGTRLVNFAVSDAEGRAAGASVFIIVGAPPAMCGNSMLEAGEQCDDGNTNAGDCCSPACAFEPADTVCRAAGGVCDVAETCTGTSARCPGDVKASGVCRAAVGVCDVAERCDGASVDCPADAFSTQTCRAAAGACDVLEQCDGTSAACPSNAFAPEEQSCGGSQVCRAGVCTTTGAGGGGGGNVGGGGCTCLAAPGSESGLALLGLVLLGLISRPRRRSE